jgi:hypothetical protein
MAVMAVLFKPVPLQVDTDSEVGPLGVGSLRQKHLFAIS